MTAPDHRRLPLRDYDHLPLASLAQRIRSLTADQIGQLPGYEREHANRPAAVQTFCSRRPRKDMPLGVLRDRVLFETAYICGARTYWGGAAS